MNSLLNYISLNNVSLEGGIFTLVILIFLTLYLLKVCEAFIRISKIQ